MKKFYCLAGALLALSSLKAQTTVDFEDLTLPKVDTFYNGNDMVGTFQSAGVTFNTSYNATYDFWSGGFAYSNMRDDSTAGFANIFSAYPASGANGSEIYALNTEGDTLFFPTASDLMHIEITNTTYAYLSMKNGDAFGKKFGSPNDANGDPDGTQGKDYFYFTVYGHDIAGDIVDSLDIDLADFTSSDPNNHYILEDWKEVDLSTFKNIYYLTFRYSSSDVGDYGINTPKFFALDNLVYKESTSETVKEEIAQFNLFPNPAINKLTINGEKGIYAIYNLNGEEELRFENKGFTQLNVSMLQSGLYFVKNLYHAAKAKKLIIQ